MEEKLRLRLRKAGLVELAVLSLAGQGAATAVEVLAAAANKEGKNVYVGALLSGARRMTPNVQTLRISESMSIPRDIEVLMPTGLLLISESMVHSKLPEIRRPVALLESGTLMVCTSKTPREVDFPVNFEGKVATADAERIFLDILGLSPPPYALPALGLYIKATGAVQFDSVREAARERLARLRPQWRELNIKALEAVYESTQIWDNAKLVGIQSREDYWAQIEETRYATLAGASQGGAAAWRDALPICDEGKCTCIECVVTYYCPETVVKWTEQGYTVDYEYCKGCGICAQECVKGAVRMVTPSEALAAVRGGVR
jgi:2-oxoacid:acceptor oxidoreductase delta subunit (pyruvate/2-ketoisovalerate family)